MGDDCTLLWIACRKHMIGELLITAILVFILMISLTIPELRIKWFFEGLCGPTKDPGNSLLRDFRRVFTSLEIIPELLVRLDLSTRPAWVQELARETRVWARELLAKNTFPRCDYKEYLLWVLFHLGEEDIPGFLPLKFPGPDHQARWMAEVIGISKIKACSNFYNLDPEQTRVVDTVTEFSCLYYARAWFESGLASTAARSDLTFMRLMHLWYR